MLKLPRPAGGVGQIGFEKALELGQRLLIEGGVIELISRKAGSLQTVCHGGGGKALVGDNFTVNHEGGCAVVIEGGNTENGGKTTPPLARPSKT